MGVDATTIIQHIFYREWRFLVYLLKELKKRGRLHEHEVVSVQAHNFECELEPAFTSAARTTGLINTAHHDAAFSRCGSEWHEEKTCIACLLEERLDSGESLENILERRLQCLSARTRQAHSFIGNTCSDEAVQMLRAVAESIDQQLRGLIETLTR